MPGAGEQGKLVGVHELGITQGIIERAREAAAANDATRVSDLYLMMTPAADFTIESIEMYFEMLTDEDELLRGARLHVDWAPVAASCLECREEFETEAQRPTCPACGSQVVRLDPQAPMVQLTDVGIEDGAEG